MRLWDDFCVPVYCKCQDEDHLCADPESFIRGGGGGGNVFLLMRGENLNITIKGPSSARQQNAI